jgi:hypothetical protein
VLQFSSEFAATPRGGDTVYGFAAGLYPTDYPTLPDRRGESSHAAVGVREAVPQLPRSLEGASGRQGGRERLGGDVHLRSRAFRGNGMSYSLVRAAVDHARQRGARAPGRIRC